MNSAERALGLRAGALAAASGIGLAAAPIALADVAGSLDISVAAATVIVTAYSVGLAAAAFVAGRLVDAVGTRRTLDLSVALLAVATLATIATDVPAVLLVARAVSGLAGGGVSMAAFVAVAAVTSGPQGLRMQGLLTATSVLVLGAAPLVGGALVALGGWRAALAVPLVSVVVLAVVRRHLPDASGADATFDARGAVLAVVGCALATTAVQAPALGLDALPAIACGLVAAAAIAVLVRRARTAAVSIVPPVVLDDPRVRSLAALAAACFGSYIVVGTAAPGELAEATGWTPVAIGALLLPSALTGAGAALRVSRGGDAREPAQSLIVLAVAGALGLLIAAVAPGVVGPMAGACLATAAFAGAQVVLISATAELVSAEKLGGALGAMNFALLSGGAVGAGLFASLVGPAGTAGALALLALAPLGAALAAASAGRSRPTSNRKKAVA